MNDASDALRIRFTQSNTVREKPRPFTVYEIECRSSNTYQWLVYKRYTAFYSLHQALLKSITATPEAQRFALPNLPPKRLTRSLAAEFVEKRKNELQDYLKALIEIPQLLPNPILWQFLEVPEPVRPLLVNASMVRNESQLRATMYPNSGYNANQPNDPSQPLNDQSMAGVNGLNSINPALKGVKTVEERRCLEFVSSLKTSSNKVSQIESFTAWFFEQKPRLGNDLIRAILCGRPGLHSNDGDNQSINSNSNNLANTYGLLAVCGDVHYSHVAARAALNLLVRLLDVERNKDAHYFIDVFLSLDNTQLRRMQLATHIVSERGNRLAAFRLVHTYRNAALTSTRPPTSLEALLASLISDQWAAKEYLRWAEANSASPASQPVKQQSEPLCSKAPVLTDQPQQAHELISQCAQFVQELVHDNVGWKTVITPSDQQYNNSLSQSPTNQSPTCIHSILEFKRAIIALSEDDEVHGDHDPSSLSEPVIVTRLRCVLPHSVTAVSDLLLDDARRREWDVKFHRGEIITVSPELSLNLLTYKSFASPYKYRESLILKGALQSDTSIIICHRSVSHASVPENKNRPRAMFHAAGMYLQPLDDQTEFTWVIAGDREATLILSPDLLGETNELQQDVNNIHQLLSRMK